MFIERGTTGRRSAPITVRVEPRLASEAGGGASYFFIATIEIVTRKTNDKKECVKEIL